MAFSDGQIRRLRARLGYYQKHQGRKESGADMPWKTVSGRISLKIDANVPEERLRQFVDGVPAKPGSKERRFPVLQQHWLEAVRDFLMHEDIRYLGAHEMDPEPSAHYAAFSLSDYMNGVAQDVDAIPKGDFVRIREEDGAIVENRLYIGSAPESPVLIVAETENRYRASSPKPFDRWTERDRRSLRLQKIAHSGWAVPGAAGRLLIFLVYEDIGRYSHNYLGLDLDRLSNERLSLLRYPLAALETKDRVGGQTVRDSNEVDPRIAASIVSSVILFERDGAGTTSDSV